MQKYLVCIGPKEVLFNHILLCRQFVGKSSEGGSDVATFFKQLREIQREMQINICNYKYISE